MITTSTTTFWHIPKTAGESVEQWFRDNHIKADIKQHGARKHATPKKDQQRLEDHIWWAVVRNPYDRIASMYRYKINKDSANGRFVQSYPTFKKWCLTENMDRLVATAAPQWAWAEKCNLLIRFENLEEEFVKIQDLYNCHKPLPYKNESNHREDIDTTYTTEMREAVYKKFEEDFIKLGYDK